MRGLAHRPSSVGWIGFTKRRWLRSPPQTHARVHKIILQNIYNLTYKYYKGFPVFVKEKLNYEQGFLKVQTINPNLSIWVEIESGKAELRH